MDNVVRLWPADLTRQLQKWRRAPFESLVRPPVLCGMAYCISLSTSKQFCPIMFSSHVATHLQTFVLKDQAKGTLRSGVKAQFGAIAQQHRMGMSEMETAESSLMDKVLNDFQRNCALRIEGIYRDVLNTVRECCLAEQQRFCAYEPPAAEDGHEPSVVRLNPAVPRAASVRVAPPHAT